MSKNKTLGCILYGGIGNRMFQYASSYALAKRLGYDHQVAYVCTDRNHNIDTLTLSNIFGYNNDEVYIGSFDTRQIHKTLRDHEWEVVLEPPNKSNIDYLVQNIQYSFKSNLNVCIDGYFQFEQLFLQYRNELLQSFAEPHDITTYLNNKYNTRDSIFQRYFIHVRLGDYYNNPHHFIDLNKYYQNAIDFIRASDPNASFVVYTEDPDNLSKVYPSLQEFVVVVEPNDLAGLYLISRCAKGGICSNSTYSWWGAWLNQNLDKVIVVPNRFSPIDNSHLALKGSVVIPV